MAEAGLAAEAMVMQKFDDRTKAAGDRLCTMLPPDARPELINYLEEAAADSQALREQLKQGEEKTGFEVCSGIHRQGAGAGLVRGVGSEDDEHPDSGAQTTSLHLQSNISSLLDNYIANGLQEVLRTAER